MNEKLKYIIWFIISWLFVGWIIVLIIYGWHNYSDFSQIERDNLDPRPTTYGSPYYDY